MSVPLSKQIALTSECPCWLVGVHGACVRAKRDRQRERQIETDRDRHTRAGGVEELPLGVMGIAELVRQSKPLRAFLAERARVGLDFGLGQDLDCGTRSKTPQI